MSTASKAAFAREHGVSPTTVTRWVKRGLADETDQGRIERESSNKKLAGRPEVYRGGKIGGTPRGGPWSGNDRGNGHSAGELRTPEEWDLVLIRETLRRFGAVGIKLVSVRAFVRAANQVLKEWRGDAG